MRKKCANCNIEAAYRLPKPKGSYIPGRYLCWRHAEIEKKRGMWVKPLKPKEKELIH